MHPFVYYSTCTSSLEMECPPHSTYSPEMSLDIPTCQNPDALYVQTTGTSEGCACDTGYIMDGGVCVPIDDCGCLYGDEEIYLPVRTEK